MNARRLALALVFCVLVAQATFAASNIVISQVYGGGGNSGATYKNDFIEIFNRGTTTQSLAGWSVQYTSAAGTTWTNITNLTGSIAPGHYYLIQEAAGAAGSLNLPTPDATGNIAMSATVAKVALVSSTTALTGGCPTGGAIVDFIGYGTGTGGATCFEGATAAPTLSNTAAALRAGAGCIDTDSNSADFASGTPNPRNTASPTNNCANNPPSINNPANPIATVQQNSAPFNVSLSGSDDGGVYSWSATAGTGISSVTVFSGQGTSSVTYQVTVQNGFTGTATFTASLSDTVNAPVTKAVNIAVNALNNPPSITAPANPITTVEENAPAFTVNLSGTDDGSIYNWSAIPGTGVSTVSVTGGQGTSTATFTVNLQFGFSGTATFTASLSDNVNAAATQAVNITVNAPPPPANHIVISQVYGGGGNSGAQYNQDFVELYNPTASPVDVTGWSVQYASAAGTSWSNTQPIGGPIGPGQYYLIALATGAVGAPLPTANINGSINMSSTTGKVALVNTGDPLSGGCPLGDPRIVDFIGYGGSATCKEGSTVAPLLSNTTADIRKNGGATDTDVNGSDFVAGAPNPRRTAPISEIGPFVVTVDPTSGASIAPYDSSITVVFSEPVTVDSGWYDITCASGSHNSATLASTDSGSTWVITPNVSFAPGETCTVTLFKDAVHDVDTDDSGPNSDTLPANKVWSFSVSTGDPAPYPASVHLTMGNPSNAIDDVNVPNNYLMVKPTYALSYNRDMGRPNWVSWHLDSSWYGSLARVDTFRPDPRVPADWYRVQAFDFSLTGFDRGHMTPNADRDNQNRIPINQETYLMSNMVAQSPDNNQGPWANLENYLRSLTDAGSEIYIVSGPAGAGGTGSNGGVTTTVANGHVVVPAYTWKAALVLPKLDGNDIARVTAATRTIVVIMPNVQGIRTVDWQTYLTSVDAVESLTGYNLFSNIPEAVQNAIEAGVNGANPPGTANQSVSTSEDNAKAFTLNVAAPNNNPLTYTIVTGPSHGQLTGTDGNRTYTPAPDFNGNDTFTYNVSDGPNTSNTSTVTLTISEVNDPPAAADDAKSTDEDTPVTFAASDLSANDSAGPANESGQTLAVTSVSATATTHGNVVLSSGNVTYTPDPNFNGPASFTYQVCDNGTTAGLTDSQCTTATVNMTVNPVNDPPVAADDSKSTSEDIPLTFAASDLTANDSAGPANESGQTLTLTSVTSTANTHGNVVLSSGNVTYTPEANFNGAASFTYQVCDGPSDPLCTTATVNVTVNEVNDPPVAANDAKSTNEDTPLTFAASDLTANDSTGPADESGQSLTVTSVSATANTHGNVVLNSGNVTYTPDPNFNGAASFTYQVCDNGTTAGLTDSQCTTATVNMAVNAVNDPPVAADDSKSTSEDTPLTFAASDLTANDSTGPANESGQTLTVTAVTSTASTHGNVVLSSGNVTYTPEANFNGAASFTYQVCDGPSDPLCTTATVNVTVSEVNDPPVAADDVKNTNEDTPLMFAAIDLTANDSSGPANESGQSLTVTSVSSTANTHGNVTLNSGNVLYTPEANFNGAASFTYQVCDNGTTAGSPDSLCTTATVNMTVNAVNDPPSAAINAPSTGAEGTLISVSGLATDIDDTSFTYAWTVTKNGSPYVTGSGTPFTFTPNDNGTYVVNLVITDAHSGTDSASASIAVSNVNPVISSVTGPAASIALGNPATIVVSYSDAGSADTHTATLTWDDTTSSTVSCAAGTCTATHTFTATGVYHVGVTVTDDDGGTATSDFQYVVVYDPSAGFVTGSGWITSPAGALVSNPTATGKATFGFVSKYQKGQSKPAGTTQFDFTAGSFSFTSTAYDWLVIAGAKAQYKGTGTVANSTATYGFLLTATDGDLKNGNAAGPDKFRIKIWNIATSNVVYDNALGASDDIDAANPQVLGGGNISINGNK